MKSTPAGVTLGALLVLAALLHGPVEIGATTFDVPGFSQEVVAANLDAPTAFAFMPGGRIIIAQKGGVVRIVKNGALLAGAFIDVSDRVNDYFDRGLLGIAVDPDFAANPYVYLLYVYENDLTDYEGSKTARLARYTVTGDTADPASEFVLLGHVVGSVCPAGSDCMSARELSHSVGNVKFASDGTIFLTLGDASSFSFVDDIALLAQDLDSLSGKVIRITRTGQGLPTNPFWTGNASDNRSKVWAYGLRNAYRFNLRPSSDIPYLGDVGWNDREEVDVAKAGANLGWPCYEGSAKQAGFMSKPICQALYTLTAPPGTLTSLGVPIARVTAPIGVGGGLAVIRDGFRPPVGSAEPAQQWDSYDGPNAASNDWVGYQFASAQTFSKLVFQEGLHFGDGGWFVGAPTVQVRQSGQWVGVSSLVIAPAYPGTNNGVSYETFTFTFAPIQGDAIRLSGTPGGDAAFISVGELEVFGPENSPPPSGGGSTEVAVTSQVQAIIARVAVSTGAGAGLGVIRDGDWPPVGGGQSTRQWDSYDGPNAASNDWVGYQFASAQTFSKLVFQEGLHFGDGGWFVGAPTVQVRQSGQWVGVSSLVIAPAYPGTNNGVSYETFTFTFAPIQGDAIRLSGTPGGDAAFISVGELEVFALIEAAEIPETPVTLPPPLLEYSRAGDSVAVTAGTFYTGSVYPAQYQGAYFFGDFAEGWLRTLRVDANDALVPGSLADFAEDANGPVDIELGPDGLLYYVAISANELRRIRYTVGNTPPTAVASANPASGLAPLPVQFSSTGSNDPDGDPITFDWDFGDGNVGTGPAPQHTYQPPSGTRVATLTVRDNHGAVTTASVTITVGNRPPVATIASPSASLQYKVGDVIAYSGSATDPDCTQTCSPPLALSWQILLHHCPGGSCHIHPLTTGVGTGGSFAVPDHGDNSHFEIVLTATDGGGLTHTVSRTIQPLTVQMTLATNPTGLQVVYDGTSGTAPLVQTTIVGSVHTLNTTSPQGSRSFVSWSDGGAQQHNVTVGTNVTYTANFGCPLGQYRAEYFNNRTLTGSPLFSRCETAINYNWGNGGPGNGIPNDNFSVRWTGRFTFPAGSRTFTTVSDDGVRLWVDNVRVINRWTDHAPTTDRVTRTMTAGDHDIKVEYYERGGGAVIQVSW